MRTVVVVPYGRMQFVDVYAGVVDRMFGLAKVQLHTASARSDAYIPGLGPQVVRCPRLSGEKCHPSVACLL